MLVLCGGALLVGAAASFALAFVPFAFALTLAIVIGVAWAGFQGTILSQAIWSALALLVATQVGYGLGLIGTAATDGARRSLRQSSAAKTDSTPLSDLHSGEKP